MRFLSTCSETALSASKGPPGASLTKKKVILATAIKTGIAKSTLLKKMPSIEFNLSQFLCILDDDDLIYLDTSPSHPHEADKHEHKYK